MSGATSVPGIQWTPTGLVLPTQAQILAGVNQDNNAAFGGNLNPNPKTPQGQFAASEAAIVAQANDAFAELTAQVDPDNATGFMQDAIGRIYFLVRNPAVPTTVPLVCGGQVGTPIPIGAQAKDTSNNIYVCTQAGTIGAGGTVTLSFANIVAGPTPCPANTVTTIYNNGGAEGWDSVNNTDAGTVGADVETAAAFEFRRQNSVAANAHGSLPAIYGAVIQVAGFIDAYAIENKGDDPLVVGSTNYSLAPHSLYIAVTGGTAADIANAIWSKKNEGSNMNGNTTYTVYDTSYSYPQPSYPMQWETPTPTAYNVVVNIVNSSALPSTIKTDVANAVAAQFNGVIGVAQANGIIPATTGQRVRIGSLLLAAQFYGPVATCEGPSVPVQVLSIYLGDDFVGTGSVTLGANVLDITAVTSGKLSPGTVVAGTGVPAGTTIVQQLSGTPGGDGQYQMSANASATETNEAITGAAAGTAQLIGIDQQPQLGTVTVNLI